MPFTPFHLGPALAIGLPLRRHIHVPTFIIANIIVDMEPFITLVFNLNYPLHGYLHTLIGAFAIGLVLSYLMYVSERILSPLWRRLLLESEPCYNLRAFAIAGVSGAILHVLMDSPLYSDIKPLYPIPINPLYNPGLTIIIYDACIFLGILGLLYCFYLIVRETLCYGLMLLGLFYITGSLYMFNMYIHGLRDISLTLCVKAPMILGLMNLTASILIFIKKNIKVSFPVVLLCCLIAITWLSYVCWKVTLTGAITPLLITLAVSLGIAQALTALFTYRRGCKAHNVVQICDNSEQLL